MSGTLNGYVTFPYAAQVACVEREIFHVRPNKTTLERVYLITSQSQAEASPAQLLAQNRGHWGIENRLHHVRDMAYDEDRCRARKGHTPRTLACLRNFTISLLRLFHVANIKAPMTRIVAGPARGTRPGPSPACGTSLSASCACSTSRTSKRHCGAWRPKPIRPWRCCVCKAPKTRRQGPRGVPPSQAFASFSPFWEKLSPKSGPPAVSGRPPPRLGSPQAFSDRGAA
ncbi:transposase [Acidiferrobacter sp. SPIII_3]|uniref:transposase n=1 Tax=Acidiferrobacter sp. SPIII_3 TaxID=1281578 RepID=UPI00351A2DA1